MDQTHHGLPVTSLPLAPDAGACLHARAAMVLRGFALLTGSLLALNLAWRLLRYALGFPLWGDEAFVVASLYTRDFSNIASHMEYGQVAPALFM